MEVQVVIQHVLDQRAEQHHVSAAANTDVAVRKSRGARVARVDVDDASTALFRFYYPLETHRVAFRHVRTLDDNAVGVRHILQRLCSTAAAKGSS